MFEAQLRGKLASEVWKKSEDLLTSAVFGTLKNLPPWITSTLMQRGKLLAGDARISFEPEEWEFWPWWQGDSDATDGCEPDVVLSSSSAMCLVEAKLYSQFGSEPGKRDQLDREWRCGERRALDSGREFSMLIVTSHPDIPRQEIESQLLAATATDPTRILWLSWTEIARHLQALSRPERPAREDLRSSELSASDRKWCNDLLALIEDMGIGPFHGFDDLVEDGRRKILSAAPPLLLGTGIGYAELIGRSRVLAHDLHHFDWMKEALPDAAAN